jgi:hypothetical protein
VDDDNLVSFITFNPNIALFHTHPSLKRIVYIALDRSIREVVIILFIIDSIACC